MFDFKKEENVQCILERFPSKMGKIKWWVLKWSFVTDVTDKNCVNGGFPGGPVVKNLPANAGDTGSVPGLGRSYMPYGASKPVCHNCWACALEPTNHNYWAHALQLLKPVCCNYWSPCAWSLCPATREATAMRSPRVAMKSRPHSPQLEKAYAQQRRPNAAKNKIN